MIRPGMLAQSGPMYLEAGQFVCREHHFAIIARADFFENIVVGLYVDRFQLQFTNPVNC